jgi:catechol 2,3-dioxygenase-like lactoylglutathione lyase family enzyme
MIDHISIGVKSLKKAKAFYDLTLTPLGYACVYTVDIPGRGVIAHGYGEGEKPSFWIGVPEKLDKKANRKGGTHVAFIARSRKAIDAFHKAAIKAGARTTASRASGRTITRTTTVHLRTTRTATRSKPAAIIRNSELEPTSEHPKERTKCP